MMSMNQLMPAATHGATQTVQRLASWRVELRDFALITHVVPAERVRRIIPRQLELETFRDTDGVAKAYVSVGMFFNDHFRWGLAPEPHLNFYQATYRTYIRHKGRPAVYFFKTYLGTPSSFLLQRTLARHALSGNFEVSTALGVHGYSAYTAALQSADGITSFELSATELPRSRAPFASGEELSQFLTFRPHGLFESSVGPLADQIVRHRRIYPWAGTLKSARFDLWAKLRILSRNEAMNPYSVLVEPSVVFAFLPPVPYRWA